MKRHMMTHPEVIALSIRLTKDKDVIERRLSRGGSMSDEAARYRVSPSGFKTVAKAVGITLPEREPSSRSTPRLLFRDMLTVLVRVAESVGVNHDEVKPYIIEPEVVTEPARERP